MAWFRISSEVIYGCPLISFFAVVGAFIVVFRALGRDPDDAPLRSDPNKLRVEELSQDRGEEAFREQGEPEA